MGVLLPCWLVVVQANFTDLNKVKSGLWMVFNGALTAGAAFLGALAACATWNPCVVCVSAAVSAWRGHGEAMWVVLSWGSWDSLVCL